MHSTPLCNGERKSWEFSSGSSVILLLHRKWVPGKNHWGAATAASIQNRQGRWNNAIQELLHTGCVANERCSLALFLDLSTIALFSVLLLVDGLPCPVAPTTTFYIWVIGSRLTGNNCKTIISECHKTSKSADSKKIRERSTREIYNIKNISYSGNNIFIAVLLAIIGGDGEKRAFEPKKKHFKPHKSMTETDRDNFVGWIWGEPMLDAPHGRSLLSCLTGKNRWYIQLVQKKRRKMTSFYIYQASHNSGYWDLMRRKKTFSATSLIFFAVWVIMNSHL